MQLSADVYVSHVILMKLYITLLKKREKKDADWFYPTNLCQIGVIDYRKSVVRVLAMGQVEFIP